MKVQVDSQKLQLVIHGISGDLENHCDTSEAPIFEYTNEAGEICQLKLVATKDPDQLIKGGEFFHCLSTDQN